MSRNATPATVRWSRLACVPALAISAVLLLAPFLASALRSVVPVGHVDFTAFAALLDSVFLSVLGRTIGFAALVSFGCMVLGTPTAYALLRFPLWATRLLLGAIGLSFLVGTLIRSYAWLAIFGARGLINSLLHLLGAEHPLKLAFSFGSMLVASIQVELPLFILPLYGVMRGIDRRLPKAAQSLGADPITAWFTVFLPLALPGLAVSTALVFLTALGFYTIPALLGPPDTYLLSQELEVRINTLGDDAGASARIVVMVLLVLAVVGLSALVHRAASRPRLNRQPLAALGMIRHRLEAVAAWLAPARWVPVTLGFVAVFVLLVLPLVILLPLSLSDDFYLRFPPRAFSLRWPLAYLGDPEALGSTLFSIEIALTAALISSLAGAVAALAMPGLTPWWQRLVTLVTVAPLVVSPITITAALYLVAIHWTWLDPATLFIAVYSVMGLPFGFLLVGAAAKRMDPRLADAAASLGATPLVTLRTVTLPILITAFGSAFVFAFLLAFDDISAGLFLSSSDRMPLAVRLWEDLKAAITPLPAAITLMATLLVGIGYGAWQLTRLALRRRARISMERAVADLLATAETR